MIRPFVKLEEYFLFHWPAGGGSPKVVGEGEGEGEGAAQLSDRDHQVKYRVCKQVVTKLDITIGLPEYNFWENLLKVSGVLGRKERLYRDLTATAVSLP